MSGPPREFSILVSEKGRLDLTKNQICRACRIVGTYVATTSKSAPGYSQILLQSIWGLINAADAEVEVRLAAEDALNRILKEVMGSRESHRTLVEILKIFKGHESLRCRRVALEALSSTIAFAHPSRGRAFASAIFVPLLEAASIVNEEMYQSLATSVNKIATILISYFSDNEVQQLLAAFLKNLSNESALIRRCACSCIISLCKFRHSKTPVDHVMRQLHSLWITYSSSSARTLPEMEGQNDSDSIDNSKERSLSEADNAPIFASEDGTFGVLGMLECMGELLSLAISRPDLLKSHLFLISRIVLRCVKSVKMNDNNEKESLGGHTVLRAALDTLCLLLRLYSVPSSQSGWGSPEVAEKTIIQFVDVLRPLIVLTSSDSVQDDKSVSKPDLRGVGIIGSALSCLLPLTVHHTQIIFDKFIVKFEEKTMTKECLANNLIDSEKSINLACSFTMNNVEYSLGDILAYCHAQDPLLRSRSCLLIGSLLSTVLHSPSDMLFMIEGNREICSDFRNQLHSLVLPHLLYRLNDEAATVRQSAIEACGAIITSDSQGLSEVAGILHKNCKCNTCSLCLLGRTFVQIIQELVNKCESWVNANPSEYWRVMVAGYRVLGRIDYEMLLASTEIVPKAVPNESMTFNTSNDLRSRCIRVLIRAVCNSDWRISHEAANSLSHAAKYADFVCDDVTRRSNVSGIISIANTLLQLCDNSGSVVDKGAWFALFKLSRRHKQASKALSTDILLHLLSRMSECPNLAGDLDEYLHCLLMISAVFDAENPEFDPLAELVLEHVLKLLNLLALATNEVAIESITSSSDAASVANAAVSAGSVGKGTESPSRVFVGNSPLRGRLSGSSPAVSAGSVPSKAFTVEWSTVVIEPLYAKLLSSKKASASVLRSPPVFDYVTGEIKYMFDSSKREDKFQAIQSASLMALHSCIMYLGNRAVYSASRILDAISPLSEADPIITVRCIRDMFERVFGLPEIENESKSLANLAENGYEYVESTAQSIEQLGSYAKSLFMERLFDQNLSKIRNRIPLWCASTVIAASVLNSDHAVKNADKFAKIFKRSDYGHINSPIESKETRESLLRRFDLLVSGALDRVRSVVSSPLLAETLALCKVLVRDGIEYVRLDQDLVFLASLVQRMSPVLDWNIASVPVLYNAFSLLSTLRRYQPKVITETRLTELASSVLHAIMSRKQIGDGSLCLAIVESLCNFGFHPRSGRAVSAAFRRRCIEWLLLCLQDSELRAVCTLRNNRLVRESITVSGKSANVCTVALKNLHSFMPTEWEQLRQVVSYAALNRISSTPQSDYDTFHSDSGFVHLSALVAVAYKSLLDEICESPSILCSTLFELQKHGLNGNEMREDTHDSSWMSPSLLSPTQKRRRISTLNFRPISSSWISSAVSLISRISSMTPESVLLGCISVPQVPEMEDSSQSFKHRGAAKLSECLCCLLITCLVNAKAEGLTNHVLHSIALSDCALFTSVVMHCVRSLCKDAEFLSEFSQVFSKSLLPSLLPLNIDFSLSPPKTDFLLCRRPNLNVWWEDMVWGSIEYLCVDNLFAQLLFNYIHESAQYVTKTDYNALIVPTAPPEFRIWFSHISCGDKNEINFLVETLEVPLNGFDLLRWFCKSLAVSARKTPENRARFAGIFAHEALKTIIVNCICHVLESNVEIEISEAIEYVFLLSTLPIQASRLQILSAVAALDSLQFPILRKPLISLVERCLYNWPYDDESLDAFSKTVPPGLDICDVIVVCSRLMHHSSAQLHKLRVLWHYYSTSITEEPPNSSSRRSTRSEQSVDSSFEAICSATEVCSFNSPLGLGEYLLGLTSSDLSRFLFRKQGKLDPMYWSGITNVIVLQGSTPSIAVIAEFLSYACGTVCDRTATTSLISALIIFLLAGSPVQCLEVSRAAIKFVCSILNNMQEPAILTSILRLSTLICRTIHDIPGPGSTTYELLAFSSVLWKIICSFAEISDLHHLDSEYDTGRIIRLASIIPNREMPADLSDSLIELVANVGYWFDVSSEGRITQGSGGFSPEKGTTMKVIYTEVEPLYPKEEPILDTVSEDQPLPIDKLVQDFLGESEPYGKDEIPARSQSIQLENTEAKIPLVSLSRAKTVTIPGSPNANPPSPSVLPPLAGAPPLLRHSRSKSWAPVSAKSLYRMKSILQNTRGRRTPVKAEKAEEIKEKLEIEENREMPPPVPSREHNSGIATLNFAFGVFNENKATEFPTVDFTQSLIYVCYACGRGGLNGLPSSAFAQIWDTLVLKLVKSLNENSSPGGLGFYDNDREPLNSNERLEECTPHPLSKFCHVEMYESDENGLFRTRALNALVSLLLVTQLPDHIPRESSSLLHNTRIGLQLAASRTLLETSTTNSLLYPYIDYAGASEGNTDESNITHRPMAISTSNLDYKCMCPLHLNTERLANSSSIPKEYKIVLNSGEEEDDLACRVRFGVSSLMYESGQVNASQQCDRNRETEKITDDTIDFTYLADNLALWCTNSALNSSLPVQLRFLAAKSAVLLSDIVSISTLLHMSPYFERMCGQNLQDALQTVNRGMAKSAKEGYPATMSASFIGSDWTMSPADDSGILKYGTFGLCRSAVGLCMVSDKSCIVSVRQQSNIWIDKACIAVQVALSGSVNRLDMESFECAPSVELYALDSLICLLDAAVEIGRRGAQIPILHVLGRGAGASLSLMLEKLSKWNVHAASDLSNLPTKWIARVLTCTSLIVQGLAPIISRCYDTEAKLSLDSSYFIDALGWSEKTTQTSNTLIAGIRLHLIPTLRRCTRDLFLHCIELIGSGSRYEHAISPCLETLAGTILENLIVAGCLRVLHTPGIPVSEVAEPGLRKVITGLSTVMSLESMAIGSAEGKGTISQSLLKSRIGAFLSYSYLSRDSGLASFAGLDYTSSNSAETTAQLNISEKIISILPHLRQRNCDVFGWILPKLLFDFLPVDQALSHIVAEYMRHSTTNLYQLMAIIDNTFALFRADGHQSAVSRWSLLCCRNFMEIKPRKDAVWSLCCLLASSSPDPNIRSTLPLIHICYRRVYALPNANDLNMFFQLLQSLFDSFVKNNDQDVVLNDELMRDMAEFLEGFS